MITQVLTAEKCLSWPAIMKRRFSPAVDLASAPGLLCRLGSRYVIGTTVTHYRVLRKIGSGGMGEVYEAEDLILGRHVALKFLLPERSRDPGAVDRFLREARAASALNHPNICTVHEIGEHEGRHFLVTELLVGHTLKHLLSAGPMPPDSVRDVALQIARGLAAAHATGITHRDIKPENIFVTQNGLVKLLDFGLVKLTEQNPILDATLPTSDGFAQTSPGALVGTLLYMSPEQLRCDPVGNTSDIFSFGIVIWEMLSGAHPFLRETPVETASAILKEALPSFPQPELQTPAAWDAILSKMLAKHPSARYATAQEFLDDFANFRGAATSSLDNGAAPARPDSSIAVLPLANLSGTPDTDYFGDGLAEELISMLMGVDGLRVAARTSSFRFRGTEIDVRDVGKQLNVSSILEGSVRKSGNKLRITVMLVNVADGFCLWSAKYDREMSDIFAIQDEISQAIVAGLRITLRGAVDAPIAPHPTANPDAYNLYLQGRFFWNKRTAQDLQKGIACFKQATDRDPQFVAALAGLADCYATQAIYGLQAPAEVIPLAREAALKALAINERLAEAHASLGCIRAVYDWDWQGAEKEFQRAAEISPRYGTAHHWYAANCLLPLGRFDQARVELQVACDLEPLSLVIRTTVGLQFFLERRHDEAIEALRKVVALDENFGMAHFFLGQVYIEKRMFTEAVAELEMAASLAGYISEGVAILGAAYAGAGKKEETQRRFKELDQRSRTGYVSPLLFMHLLLALGEKDQALRSLKQAREVRACDLIWLNVRPAFDSLRHEPGFVEICREVGLAK
jgi:serine/threonine protein kinase/Tfp pilus assembly protein PilF